MAAVGHQQIDNFIMKKLKQEDRNKVCLKIKS